MQLNFHLNDYHINPEAKPNVFAFKLKEPFFFVCAGESLCGAREAVTTKNPPTL